MRSIIYLLAFISFLNSCVFAQTTPLIQLQKCFGGSATDVIVDIKKTADASYICAAYSSSNNFDVSGNHGSTDFWLVKLDSTFNLLWQKSLGGTQSDVAVSIVTTQDGGFLIGGNSYSNDGDVSGHHGPDLTDYWVVKTDASGNIEWQKSLGGTGTDYLQAVLQAGDGSYYITGYTNSTDGDVTGNHGQTDVWIVHLDQSGNILWQKCFGGSLGDYGWSLVENSNGTFTVVGGTASDNGDVSSNYGGDGDGWLFNMDGPGNILWEKNYGGTKYDFIKSIIPSSDGNYVMVGFSYSTDFDVNTNHGVEDVWALKSDPSGNVIWSRSFGGSQTDLAYNACETINSRYAIYGISSSNDGDVSGNNGLQDCWLVEISTDGQLIWQKSLGSGAHDAGYTILNAYDGSLLLGGYAGENSGNVSGNHGSIDGWLISMEDECNTFTIADFSFTQATNTYSFADQSTNALTWQWNFGDGVTSNLQNPVHTYTGPGIYEVCLITTNGCFFDTACTEIITCGTLSADFGYQQNGLTYSFFDSSSGNNSWSWDFGDGTNSTLQNPVHTFSQDGIYSVCLTVKDSCDSKVKCEEINTCESISVNFSFTINGFDVAFTNSSSGLITGYTWDFDDGTTSNLQNPFHSYTAPGNYKVKLTIESNCETASIKQTVKVCGPAQASFTIQQNGAWVQFINTSVYFDSYIWDFGSGPLSILSDPLHYFINPGTYNVCLIADNKCEKDTFCQTITAPVSEVLTNCWSATFDNSLNAADIGYKIAGDADGNVLVAGNNDDDLFLLKYDANGNLLWVQSYDTAGFSFHVNDMALDGNNNVCITAYQQEGFSPQDWITLKYDPAGNLLWHREEGLGNGLTDIPYALDIDQNNNIYVGGTRSVTSYDRYFHLIGYDSNGTITWQASYNYDQFEDQIYDLVVDSSGNVYVTGEFTHHSGSASTSGTIKYDANETMQWSVQESPGVFSYSRFLGMNHAGNLVMAGYGSNFGEYNNTYVSSHDPNSNLLWLDWEAPDNAEDMYRTKLAGAGFDSLDNVYLCYGAGYSDKNSDEFSSALLLKYNSAGNLLWKREYFGALSSEFSPNDATIDALGNIYITGFTNAGEVDGDSAFTETVKFNSDGEPVWLRIFDESPGRDEPNAIGSDYYGNILITGYTINSVSGYDVATVKYCGTCDLPVLFSLSQDTFCVGASPFVLTGGQPIGGYYSGDGVSNGIFYADSAGAGSHTITYTFTDSTGCVAANGQQLFVDVCTSVTPVVTDLKLEIFPNPTSADATVQLNMPVNGIIEILITGIDGKKIRSIANGYLNAGMHSFYFSTEGLPKGMYLVQVRSSQFIENRKLILE